MGDMSSDILVGCGCRMTKIERGYFAVDRTRCLGENCFLNKYIVPNPQRTNPVSQPTTTTTTTTTGNPLAYDWADVAL